MILNPIGTNLVMQADDDLRHAEEEEDANHSVSRLTMNNLGILDHQDRNNGYIMKKIDQLSSSKKRLPSKSFLIPEHPIQQDQGTKKSTDRLVAKTAQSAKLKESQTNFSEIDMSDNIFLAHKNQDLIRKRKEEIKQQMLSQPCAANGSEEEELDLNQIE